MKHITIWSQWRNQRKMATWATDQQHQCHIKCFINLRAGQPRQSTVQRVNLGIAHNSPGVVTPLSVWSHECIAWHSLTVSWICALGHHKTSSVLESEWEETCFYDVGIRCVDKTRAGCLASLIKSGTESLYASWRQTMSTGHSSVRTPRLTASCDGVMWRRHVTTSRDVSPTTKVIRENSIALNISPLLMKSKAGEIGRESFFPFEPGLTNSLWLLGFNLRQQGMPACGWADWRRDGQACDQVEAHAPSTSPVSQATFIVLAKFQIILLLNTIYHNANEEKATDNLGALR